MKESIFLGVLILLLIVGVVYCNLSPSGANSVEEITVFAAASLTEGFTEIKEVYEGDNPNIKINLNFAGSQALKTSLENGVEADLFVSANLKYMEELKSKGFLGDYRVFLYNRLILIKNKNSPFTVTTLRDLSKDGIRIAVGDKTVPVGSYWEQALSSGVERGEISPDIKEKIDLNIKTRELNVKDVVSKVLLDEVDFGVVYKNDLTKDNADRLEEIELSVFSEFIAVYPSAILNSSEDRKEVVKFYDFLNSQQCKEILKRYRFSVD